MGWLNHVYNENAASARSSIKKFHQKISHFLYETYTRTRIEQLFNIIIGEHMLCKSLCHILIVCVFLFLIL
jgi:hypothetical protein